VERWRKPLSVIEIEQHDDEVLWLPDGRMQRQVRVVYDRESTERIRHGVACAKCMEPFPEAWPEHCPVCGAPVRERQAEFFAREYALQEVASRPSLEEEIEGIRGRAEEEEERRRRL
jgi:uncharacterized paraquat-inducible protein A